MWIKCCTRLLSHFSASLGLLFAGVVLGTVLCAPAAARADDVSIVGRWDGTVTQPGAKHETYPVVVTFTTENSGAADYASLKCGGTLTLEKKTGNTYVYREHITRGQDACIDNGVMEITLNNDTTAQWSWWHNKGDERATATLTRPKPAGGFTGKKVVHLTAKSWIDPATIAEITFKSFKLKLFPNVEPRAPKPDSGKDDFKIYQTYVAEVVFEQGKITSAKFLKDSFDYRAGRTGGVQGEVRLIDAKIDVSTDKTKAVFRRTVEGNPNFYLVIVPDSAFPSSIGLNPISNTLSVEITADSVKPEGKGTAFPSHTFWMGDEVFKTQRQVQPSEFFK